MEALSPHAAYQNCFPLCHIHRTFKEALQRSRHRTHLSVRPRHPTFPAAATPPTAGRMERSRNRVSRGVRRTYNGREGL